MIRRSCFARVLLCLGLLNFCASMSAGAEARLAEVNRALNRQSDKLDVVLAAFEPREVALAEDLTTRLEVERELLRAFVKGVAASAVQYTMV